MPFLHFGTNLLFPVFPQGVRRQEIREVFLQIFEHIRDFIETASLIDGRVFMNNAF